MKSNLNHFLAKRQNSNRPARANEPITAKLGYCHDRFSQREQRGFVVILNKNFLQLSKV